MDDGCKVSREKYWSESDPEEKCRRLRDEVKRMQRQIQETAKVVANLSVHAHGPDGKVLIPLIDSSQWEKERPIQRGEDVYF